ncbi:MAG: hypothetical protein GF308_17015 [Candidatus Heimdallarchaeota archaeon]|nr:hypothetical protein [Candidatus Heimdallarchaeota archaeon]
MNLPLEFSLHEKRLSQPIIEALYSAFNRQGLALSDLQMFLSHFLETIKFPPFPQEDAELQYLASKVAFIVGQYNYPVSNKDPWFELPSLGARAWQGLIQAKRGDIKTVIKHLDTVRKKALSNQDFLVYIETLSILAELYHSYKTKNPNRLSEILDAINLFQEEHASSLPNFSRMFLRANFIANTIKADNLPPEQAEPLILDFSETINTIEDLYWETKAKLILATIKMDLEKYPDAKELLNEVFATTRELSFEILKAETLSLMGQMALEKQLFSEAKSYFEQAHSIYQENEDLRPLSIVSNNLANLALKRNEVTVAEKHGLLALQSSKKIEVVTEEINSLITMGKVYYFQAAYTKSLTYFQKALKLAQKHNFKELLLTIYDAISIVEFLSGDFNAAITIREKNLQLKQQLNYSKKALLIERMKLGQLLAIVGNLETAFNEFEIALKYCQELNFRDELYFDILIWLFDLATALNKLSLANTYLERADLFATIHNSEDENLSALVSRARFLQQKKELDRAEELLNLVFEKSQVTPSPLIFTQVLVQNALLFFLRFKQEGEETFFQTLLEIVEDLLIISLDLDFLPLTIYAKRALARLEFYREQYSDGLVEVKDAIGFAEELGIPDFKEKLKTDLTELNQMVQNRNKSTSASSIKKRSLAKLSAYLYEIFWLVNTSALQRIKA